MTGACKQQVMYPGTSLSSNVQGFLGASREHPTLAASCPAEDQVLEQ